METQRANYSQNTLGNKKTVGRLLLPDSKATLSESVWQWCKIDVIVTFLMMVAKITDKNW